MKKASSGINATMGTLSGAEQISQSCRQSIISLVCKTSSLVIPKRSGESVDPCPADGASLSCCFRSSPRLVGFFRQHDRGRTRDPAVLPYAPEVHNHQHTRHDRDADAVPY